MFNNFQDPIPPNRKPQDRPPHHPNPPPQHCETDLFMQEQEIQNVAHLRSFIKGQLGAPVICVELADSQINAVIKRMVTYVWRYYYREGNYRDYLVMELIPGKTKYKICQELESVVDFNTSCYLGAINEILTVPHNMLYDTMMSNFSYNGTCYGDASYGDVLGNWHATLTWLKQVKNDFGESYQVRYNTKEKELSVWPAPKPRNDHKPTVGIMEVYKRQRLQKIFNDFWFQELVITHCGMLWTSNLSKYNLTISGGGTLNADSQYQKYKERYDAAIEQIYKESPNGDCIFTG